MALSNSNNGRMRRRGLRRRDAADEQLKQQRMEKHLDCDVCTKIAYPGTDALIPLIADQDDLFGTDFDAGIYAYIYQMNSPRDNNNNQFMVSIRVDDATATKTQERCAKHVRKLQSELTKTAVIQTEDQNYTGDNDRARMIAPFDFEEIMLGNLIGTGGFSSVFEIASFQPRRDLSENMSTHERNSREYLADDVFGPTTGSSDTLYPKRKDKGKVQERRVPRYAIKHLRIGLIKEPDRFERAALDLVLEAQLLLAMDHPNIISLRGWSSQGVDGFLSGKHTSFFIIIDRLRETLENRIFRWRADIRRYRISLKLPWSRQKYITKLDIIYMERLQVAYDIASALEYMHDRRIIYRDLKSTNIGFDVRGDLKLFDFGLSRLLPSNRDEDAYLMSRVGTKYYMAPEVRRKLPYNLSADVYSFGVLMWEVMAMGSPREALRKHKEDGKESTLPCASQCPLPLCKCWPEEVRQILSSSLSISPLHRPKIADVRCGLERMMDRLGYKPQIDAARRRLEFRVDLSVGDYTSQATSEDDYFPEVHIQKTEDSKQEIVLSQRDLDSTNKDEDDSGVAHDRLAQEAESILEDGNGVA